MNIIEARTEAHFDAVRRLLAAYVAEQGFSPNTSSIFRDLGEIPGRYAPPGGRLLLAMSGDEPVGCIGLARATDQIGELKRLYVSPARRGAGVGRALCGELIAQARAAGYQQLALSARDSWKPAVTLFQSLGFRIAPPFKKVKPIDLVFMSLDLTIAPPALKPVSSAQIYKVSGSDLDDPKFSAALARELANRWRAGTRLALVHGGGKELTDLLTALQIPTRFSDGLRVTTRAGRDAALMVLSGLANKRLTAAIVGEGVSALGVCGIDAGVVRVERINDELQFVGKPVAVRASVLAAWLDAGLLPVIAPMSLGVDGEIYNVNADHVAGAIAAAMGAELLTFITNVPGVLDQQATLIPTLTERRTEALIADGTISGGMIPKVRTCLEALAAGVSRVRITNLAGVSAGTGTVFTHQAPAPSP
jgi:acetylglutamate kinase